MRWWGDGVVCSRFVHVLCQQSLRCVDLDYFKRLWVFGGYGLVEFTMQLGEVCKLFLTVAFGGSVLDGQ